MSEWVNNIRKARKPHRCMSCDRPIDKGEDYNRTVCFDGGRALTYKECVHCRAFAEITRDDLDPDNQGYDYYAFADLECTSSAIAVMHGEWSQKWRHLDGTLMPIPSLELALAITA